MTSKAPKLVSSVREYKSAFQKIREQMTEKQHEMLDVHYRLDGHITTATILADLMKYKGAGGTKLQYGKLGSMVSRELGLGSLGVITLAVMVPPDYASNQEWLWVMRPNVAQALEELKWVKDTSNLFFPTRKVGDSKYF